MPALPAAGHGRLPRSAAAGPPRTLWREANGVSDNPLVFSDTGEVLSGGNFHAEPVAFAADIIALAICEIGSIAERRITMLTDPALSGLPAFLTPKPGLNSGFMIAQVTAAALVSENKSRAYPASVDSIPTSANQEDHVSMAAHAARRLKPMAENAAHVIGIELLAGAQGCDFHAPMRSSDVLERVRAGLRAEVPALEDDRYFATRHGARDPRSSGPAGWSRWRAPTCPVVCARSADPVPVRIIPAQDLVRTPWKNGGGTTAEVAVHPPGAGFEDFDWRISMADVAADGPVLDLPRDRPDAGADRRAGRSTSGSREPSGGWTRTPRSWPSRARPRRRPAWSRVRSATSTS